MFYQWLLMERHPGYFPDMISIVLYFSILTLDRMKVWDVLMFPIFIFFMLVGVERMLAWDSRNLALDSPVNQYAM